MQEPPGTKVTDLQLEQIPRGQKLGKEVVMLDLLLVLLLLFT